MASGCLALRTRSKVVKERWLGKAGTAARFDRVAKLVEGFETPFGLERLATVHWVTTREDAVGAEDAGARVHAWNERKKPSPRQIGIAFQGLQNNGWLANT